MITFDQDKLAALMYYMRERESIRLKKEVDELPFPWTSDPILQKFKFTNVKRSNDRTTRAFVEFYHSHYEMFAPGRRDAALLYNCGVARYFGSVEFQFEIGWLVDCSTAKLVKTAQRMRKAGQKVWTGAYVITAGGSSAPKEETVAGYLEGLWQMAANIVAAMKTSCSWRAGYVMMAKLPGFGGAGFMAKEVLQDFLLITRLRIDDAETWTPMGPGARRGMNRMLGRPVDAGQPEYRYIEEVQVLHSIIKLWWQDVYPGSEMLTAHDVQFCLCEFDKYERVRLGEGRAKSTYTPPGLVQSAVSLAAQRFANTPAERKRRSERAKKQFASGKFLNKRQQNYNERKR